MTKKKNYLFDFMSFFAWTFLNFSGLLWFCRKGSTVLVPTRTKVLTLSEKNGLGIRLSSTGCSCCALCANTSFNTLLYSLIRIDYITTTSSWNINACMYYLVSYKYYIYVTHNGFSLEKNNIIMHLEIDYQIN